MTNTFTLSNQLTVIEGDDFRVCIEYRSVIVNQKEIMLTAKEFDIFALLIVNSKRVFTYEMLADMIWMEPYEAYSPKLVRNHISNLKKKLGVSNLVAKQIKCVYGVGYKFSGNVKITHHSS